MNNNTPYENLGPDLILDAVESLGFICSGNLLALNSYENRVYQIGIEDAKPMIAKFYRPHRWSDETILEEHQFALELLDYEIPVVAPWMNSAKETLHHYKDYRFALFPKWGGRALDLDKPDQLEWIGRFIGRLHAVGACRKFQHRPVLNVKTYGYEAYEFLIQNNFIPAEIKKQYSETVEQLLEIISGRMEGVHNIRLHGDMHHGNVLWDDAGPHIVDLDDCVMGPAVQDIWMLLAGRDEVQLGAILRGYQEFYDFDYSQLHLIEPLRTLRMIYYSSWLARRWEDPTFPQNFPWFNTLNYWHEQWFHLNEQLDHLR